MNISTPHILARELEWLDCIIQYRFNQTKELLKKPEQSSSEITSKIWPDSLQPSELLTQENSYAKIVGAIGLTIEERLLLVLSLAVHVDPYFFTVRQFMMGKLDQRLGHPGFGSGLLSGVRYNGLVPSGHTYLILVAGNNLELRLLAARYLLTDRPLFQKKIIHLEQAQDSDPIYLGKLVLAHAYFEMFIGLRTHNFTAKNHE